MKKQMLKIISAAAAAGMLLQTGAFAFGGTYPEHPEYSGAGGQENSVKGDWEPTDPDYLFTVGGKQFILLDTDDEGNYFVLAEDEYGKHAVDTSFAAQPVIETRTLGEDGSYTYTQGDVFPTIVDSQWVYNPEDSTNIGYWLNNDFYNGGNGGDYILPEEIKENIIEKEWQVEGLKTALDWTAVQNYDEARARQYADERTLPGYTVGGKLSFLSYTEYKQYQDIIGFGYCDKGWNGFILRTPHALLTSDGTNLKYAFGGLQVRNRGAAPSENTNDKMIITVLDQPTVSDYFYVRPCFWLDKDFFQKVKCDVNTVGNVPKNEILKNSDEILGALYNETELLSLKGKRSWDWGHYPEHPSDVKKLTNIDVDAGGICGPTPEEYLFTVGNENNKARFILLDRDVEGRYFVMADEIYGKSAQIAGDCGYYKNLIAEKPNKKTWNWSEWSFNPEFSDTLAFLMNHPTWNHILGDGKYGIGGSGKCIPNEVVDDIVEYDWELEPFYPGNGWKTDGLDVDVITDKAHEEIDQWTAEQIATSAKTTVRAKTALLSYTEFQQYKDRIGFPYQPDALAYAGTLLRTPYALIDSPNGDTNNPSDEWSVVTGNMTILATNANSLRYSYSNITDQAYLVRPVMWLEKDFFKNNKIDVDTAGDIIFAEMRDLYTYEDLKDTYTAAEIDAMGIEVEKLSNVEFTSVGEAVTDIGTVSEITVSADVLNLGRPGTLIVAVYSDDRLLGVNFQNVDFADGETAPVSVTVEGFSGADSVKAMLWSGISGESAMLPEYITEI